MTAYIPWNSPEFSAALNLQRSIGLVDMHVDPILQTRLFGYDIAREHKAGRPGQPLFWHSDIPRMHEAGYGTVCMGIHWYPWESERGWQEALKQIDVLDALARNNPDVCARPGCAADIGSAASSGKLSLIPGVEGAHIINGKLERVAELARRGTAYMTLAHFSKNAAATPSMGRGANERDGLTDFGVTLVQELNRHQIVVDISHLNMPCAIQACRASSRPVLATHSGARGLNDAARLLSDEAIDAVAATDGVVGVIFAPGFLTGKLNADSHAVADHIEYIVKRVGIRHVGLGSDYDGWLPRIPSDQRDCRDLVKITHILLQRGWSESSIALLLRDNVVRVMTASATGAPVEPPTD